MKAQNGFIKLTEVERVYLNDGMQWKTYPLIINISSIKYFQPAADGSGWLTDLVVDRTIYSIAESCEEIMKMINCARY